MTPNDCDCCVICGGVGATGACDHLPDHGCCEPCRKRGDERRFYQVIDDYGPPITPEQAAKLMTWFKQKYPAVAEWLEKQK